MKAELSATRLYLLRAGYLLVGLGLALVKWPQLADAHTLPLYENVTLCLLTAMSLFALIGVWRPLRMLPVLLFEITWKLLWAGLVALPQAHGGHLDDATREVLINSSVGIVVVVVVPWGHVWRTFVQPRPIGRPPATDAAPA